MLAYLPSDGANVVFYFLFSVHAAVLGKSVKVVLEYEEHLVELRC